MSDIDYQPPEFPSFSTLQSQQLVKMEQSTTTSSPMFSSLQSQKDVKMEYTSIPAPPPSFSSMQTQKTVKMEQTSMPTPPPSFSYMQNQQMLKMEQVVAPSPPPAIQAPIVSPAPPSVPPKFTKPVSTAIVTEGEKLFLEAQYEGMCKNITYV